MWLKANREGLIITAVGLLWALLICYWGVNAKHCLSFFHHGQCLLKTWSYKLGTGRLLLDKAGEFQQSKYALAKGISSTSQLPLLYTKYGFLISWMYWGVRRINLCICVCRFWNFWFWFFFNQVRCGLILNVMYMVYGDKNVDLIFWILLGSYLFSAFEIILMKNWYESVHYLDILWRKQISSRELRKKVEMDAPRQ